MCSPLWDDMLFSTELFQAKSAQKHAPYVLKLKVLCALCPSGRVVFFFFFLNIVLFCSVFYTLVAAKIEQQRHLRFLKQTLTEFKRSKATLENCLFSSRLHLCLCLYY